MTPKSDIIDAWGEGDGSVDLLPTVAATIMLVRLLTLFTTVDVDDLRTTAGDWSVEERLEIRGILVGVSFVSRDVLG